MKKLVVQLYKNGDVAYNVKHFFSKTQHWKYEKELRLVLEQKGGRYYHIRPEEMLRLVPFDSDCLEYVIAGEHIMSEHRNIR